MLEQCEVCRYFARLSPGGCVEDGKYQAWDTGHRTEKVKPDDMVCKEYNPNRRLIDYLESTGRV